MNKTVLISGAGVAGSTLAYWLARQGYEVTVVERAAALRSSGNPVDVKGPAVAVAEQMGIMPQLRAAGSAVDRMTFVDGSGKSVGRIPLAAFQGSGGDREVEVPRADLAAILLAASRAEAEFVWGDTITGLTQDSEGVGVTFAKASPRRFDLVIGADGLHSTVRRLAFGPESEFVRHKGMFVATMPIDAPVGSDREVVIYNTPGRAVSVHPTRGRALAAFIFRHDAVPGFDHRDQASHKRLVAEAYSGGSWRLPELLQRMDAADLYFDAVSQVDSPTWSTGRIALVGDAGSSLSLFGDGSTLAMAGAYTLAEELGAADNPATALHRYEARHRKLVRSKQGGFRIAGALLVPATRTGIALRNGATRLTPALTALANLRSARTVSATQRVHAG
ncbi:FAD-dependent oxidoreductase [Nocardia sp. NPDC060256]|uniref:FAD-dependent oxidoreductase n=1 Tax=unclassified Nocardia TaxID=2637762 RepID=UPI00364BF320